MLFTLQSLKGTDVKSILFGPDRGFVSVGGDVVHLVEVVVQEALLRVGLDDLTQGLPAQLLGGQSGRLTVDPLRRPGGGGGEAAEF